MKEIVRDFVLSCFSTGQFPDESCLAEELADIGAPDGVDFYHELVKMGEEGVRNLDI